MNVTGDEEYNASGPSIKRAQHAAAQQALQNSKYPQPQPKPKVKNPVTVQGDMKPITPTVQLNALAMKLNLPPVYTTMVPVPAVQAGTQPFGHNHPTNGKLNGIGSVAGIEL
jgi:double-stranded RNA-binding protein Staufen